jgi:uncharacterized protein YacL
MGEGSLQPRNAVAGIVGGAIVGFLVSPLLISLPYNASKRLLGRMPPGDLLSAVIGLILGLIVAALLSYPLSFLPWWFGHFMPAVVAVLGAYAGVSLMMMRHKELFRILRIHVPESSDNAGISSDKLLVDTSAIIDGRLADIVHTGFLHGTLVVPRFVLKELQRIADSSDPLRRNRGRRGLDILNTLQKEQLMPIEISDIDASDIVEVDGKLVHLASQMGGPVLTNDFNLNRVAEIQGVRVLNINQLANALKPVVLPGEEMAVRIIQEGKEHNQGLAYLDDGTMIVVENGRRHLNCDLEVVVTRVLQTVAGRMIFAQPKNNGHQ